MLIETIAAAQRRVLEGWSWYWIASHAAVALSNARTDADLRQAISTRQLIGEALGIIMERHKLPEDAAFALLTKVSQDHNVKIRDLAHKITLTGKIPPPNPQPS